jgi:hypothetical protein
MFVSIPFSPKVARESLTNRRVIGFEICYVHNNAVELVDAELRIEIRSLNNAVQKQWGKTGISARPYL